MNLQEIIKRDKISLIITIIAGIISMILSIYSGVLYNKSDITDNNLIDNQIQTLNSMSKNLKEMLDFIEIQKKNITDEQLLLENIQQQRKELEPLLNTDKQIVEAILTAQNKYEKKNIWIERAIAFFLGIASSMIGTLLYNRFKKNK